jgi:sensor domain CHASE-containing protein
MLAYVATQLVLMPNYLSLEDQITRENLTRALNALQDEIDNLDKYVTIYAWSDDATNFIRTLDHGYVLSNLQDANFIQIRINAVVFTNAQNQVVYSTEYQPGYGEEIPLPGELNASLFSVSIQSYAISLGARMNESSQARMSGLVILPEGPMLISIRHILPSNRTGPVQGNLLMGRYLDSLEITTLEQITHVSLTLHRPDDPEIPRNLFTLAKSADGESILTMPADPKTIDAYTILDDVTGHPILVLQVEMPRDIYNAGLTTVEYIMASLAFAGFLFGCVSMAILEKTIFSRMTKLERDVSEIGAQGRFSSRLNVAGVIEMAATDGNPSALGVNPLTNRFCARRFRGRAARHLKVGETMLEAGRIWLGKIL